MQAGLITGGMLLASYLAGAIPFTLIAGYIKGIDIRKHGSGNLGATNAIRVLGKPIGLTVFLLDFLKGFGPVLAVRVLPHGWIPGIDPLLLGFGCGLASVVGHCFPVYLGFKGGKGVAAASGMLLAIRWDAALTAFVVFFLVRRITGFVSASSIALALTFPGALILYHPSEAFAAYRWVTYGSLVMAGLIVLRHRSNIGRIRRGEEPRVGRAARKTSSKEDPGKEQENG